MDSSMQAKIRNVLSNLKYKNLSKNEFKNASVYESRSCADRIYVKLKIENNKIKDISYDGQGCTIAYLSAELIARLIINKDVNDVKILLEKLKLFADDISKDLPNEETFKLFLFLNEHTFRKRCLRAALYSYLSEIEKVQK